MDLKPAIDDLDAAATLAAVEGELIVRRRAEARDLALAARWADLHASDPRRGAGGRRAWCGEDRLVEVGGDGTPWVQDLSLSELAIAKRVHHHSARATVADALDLRHRLPKWWDAVQELRLEAWVARKAASLSRKLSAVAVRLVNDCLPDDLGEVSPGRILDVVRAKVIEADPQLHAAAIDAMVDHVADLLAPQAEPGTTRDALRSEAFTWLARPAELLDLLSGGTGDAGTHARPRVVLYVHLHEDAVGSTAGVARVEDVGPVLSREIPEWLGHAHVTVKPVIDLTDHVSFDAYEHPAALAERIKLRNPADSFPHANQVSRRLDLDHVDPYRLGKRGQTGDHNSQPLSRTGHRTKTFAGYRVRQLGPDSFVWQSPHGLARWVDHSGTTVLPPGFCEELLAA